MMMQTPLLLTDLLKRAETYYAHKEIISRTSTTTVHRLTYGEWVKRTRKLAHALTKLGMERGDKIASFARAFTASCWFGINTYFGALAINGILNIMVGFDNWFVCFLD